jgi:hypothetical protein
MKTQHFKPKTLRRVNQFIEQKTKSLEQQLPLLKRIKLKLLFLIGKKK